jgi:hypothetical protein
MLWTPWITRLSGLVDGYQRLVGTYWLHPHGDHTFLCNKPLVATYRLHAS